jgi:hypothetical protein
MEFTWRRPSDIHTIKVCSLLYSSYHNNIKTTLYTGSIQPLLFSYGGIAKTKISTGFDTSMVFKIVLIWMKRDLELL